MAKAGSHIFIGQTTSLCEECLSLVPAKIIEKNDGIYYQKQCRKHGQQVTLISSDPTYWKTARDFLKPGDRPLVNQTQTERGCPWDCGLCPDHEQNSCVALVEITDHCNLHCPVCFANSGPKKGNHRSLQSIEKMFDTLVMSEGEPDVVQISGGEPTEHPQILNILQMARNYPIRHLMLNTNGVRLANDPGFVDSLAALGPGFEVYLQFDSLEDAGLQVIRGANLSGLRQKALHNLEAAGISTTLVVTVKAGVNDHALTDIFEFAREWSCVRGINYQPIQDAGRNLDFQSCDRVVLSDIRRKLIERSGVFGESDLLPLPCNPEYICAGYAIRNGRQLVPLTRYLEKEDLMDNAPNSITFEKNKELKKRLFDLFSLSSHSEKASERLHQLLCCLPTISVPEELSYKHIFRITIVQFLDRFNFCLAGVKRSCIHIVQTDGRIIPFDTFNLFYREPNQPKVLKKTASHEL